MFDSNSFIVTRTLILWRKILWLWQEFWNVGTAWWLLLRIKCSHMRKEQNTVAKPISVGVTDVFSSTHSRLPEGQFQVEVFERSYKRLRCYKTGDVLITHHWGVFAQPLLPLLNSKCYTFWGCVWSLRYPACKYTCSIFSSVACPALHFYPHYLIKGTIFEKKNVTERKMCVLIFSTTLVWKISHFKKNWARYYLKCMLVFM